MPVLVGFTVCIEAQYLVALNIPRRGMSPFQFLTCSHAHITCKCKETNFWSEQCWGCQKPI